MLQRDRIKAVIFDMDGLMLDTEPIYRMAWKQAVADCGYQFEEDGWYAQFVGRSNDDCDRLMQDIFGSSYPVKQCRDLRDRHWRHYIAANGIPLKPGLIDLLDYLDKLGMPKAIATASPRTEADLSIAASGIGTWFIHTTTGDEVLQNKPAPDIYLESARKLGVEPQDCLVFEDSNSGATAAVTAGATTIVVPDLQPPQAEIVQRTYRVVDSLHAACNLLEAAWAA